MRGLLNWFMNRKIASKIMICYVAMLLIFLILGGFIYRQFQTMTAGKVKRMSSETTRSVRNNLDFLFDTVNHQSMILLSNSTVQSALEQSGKQYNYALQTKVCNYLADFMNFNDMISSVYLFDQSGTEYYVDSGGFKNMSLAKISASDWYQRLVQLKGGYLLKGNGGGTFRPQNGNYVSLVRVVNNINTQKPIGVMVMNISVDSILSTVMQQNNARDMQIVLRDELGRGLLGTTIPAQQKNRDLLTRISSEGASIERVGGRTWIVSTLVGKFGLGITCITPFEELSRQAETVNIALFALIVAFGILLLAAFIYSSLLITRPIRQLVSSMKRVESGHFEEIKMKTGNDEIGHLKEVYNMMVRRISALIDDIIREQAVKRKKELEVLQMQIKPHFLYNSFDSISALALSGRNKDVFKMAQLLGKFYRGFLSACDEAIPIQKELEITESYITIQQIRFPGKLEVVRKIDPSCLSVKTPSLVLQPLVENAINHGLRGKPGSGTLTISVSRAQCSVRITVEDDGAGMDESEVGEIMGGSSKGVGMKSTIEKLKLYFDSERILSIQSKKGLGTKITMEIPTDGRE